MITYKLLAFLIFLCEFINAQNPPFDFKLAASAGGSAPWSISESVTILADGTVEYLKINGSTLKVLTDTTFEISSSGVQQIWQSVQNNNFFSLNPEYIDTSFKEGSYLILTITANGNTKQVRLKNTDQMEILLLLSSINSNLPAAFNMKYTPPEKINIVQQDPCNSTLSSSYTIDKDDLLKGRLNKLKTKSRHLGNTADVQIPHGGVEIGYEMSLYDAIATGRASLASKGDYYGDDVSITGYNLYSSAPSDIVTIKMNLEFYGPCDNTGNELNVVSGIYKTWDGLKTSDGRTIKMDISVLSHPNITSPPGTPGFDNIKLVCDNIDSYCDGLGVPNADGVMGGTWSVQAGYSTWGHEAGHLMGLDDQYISYLKEPDLSWVNEADPDEKYSNEEFLDLLHSRNPDKSLTDLQNDINKIDRIGWAKPGHENDLMGTGKTVLQSDIDKLAAQAGLIIDINPGDVLINNDSDQQNLIVTHAEDLFLKPGEIKTLNGIYAACIDHFSDIPGASAVFSVAPPLNKWKGINSAVPLLKLLKYIDSLKYYCNIFDDYFAQEAVWRITDNTLPYDTFADTLLMNAGIDINQVFDFPKMIYKLQDSVSSSYIPDQLFIADIEPKAVNANLNEKVNFTGSVTSPSVGSLSTGFSWIIKSPDSKQVVSNGSSADLIPLLRGIYTVSLNISVKDSTGSERNFKSSNSSYAVAADKLTETFEHNNLNDLFTWETYGDAPWTITNTTAQTGNSSIRPGNVSGYQTSSLEVTIDLPADSSITFALKTNTLSGILLFMIDTTALGYYGNFNDWTFVTQPVPAGQHIIKWIYRNAFTENNDHSVWLDNIFFPTSTKLLTSAGSTQNSPLSFNLFQNYPNPFNPITTIKYSLAKRSYVKLILYNVLGKKIRELFAGEQNQGEHEINFNASNLSSGVYFYAIEADYNNGKYKSTKKMILLK